MKAKKKLPSAKLKDVKNIQDEKLCMTKGQLMNVVIAAEAEGAKKKKPQKSCPKAKKFIKELKSEIKADEKKTHSLNISKAEDMGKQAYHAGKQAPAQDSVFLNTFAKGRPVGDPDSIKYLKAWAKGWNEEHHKESEKRLRAIGFYKK